MLRKSLVLVLACAFGIPLAAQADEAEIAVGEDLIQGTYITDGARIGIEGGDLSLQALFTDDRDLVLNGGLMFPAFVQGPVTVRVGGRAYASLLSDPSHEVFGIAPGADVRFRLPTELPMALAGSIFYSPNIVTFGDADHILDINGRFEIQFADWVTGFVGFRLLNYDRDGPGEDDVVEDIIGGLRFTF